MNTRNITIGIIGGGAWGTALGTVWAASGIPVTLWARNPQMVDDINHRHVNSQRLPDLALSPTLKATTDLGDLTNASVLVMAVPAQATRGIMAELRPHAIPHTTPIILVAKGIELGSHKLLSDVLGEVAPHHPVIHLSGPSFAEEVAKGLPTALTLASRDKALAHTWAQQLTTPSLRLYHSTDIVGVQIGGALKNVLAIACGIVDGRGMGNNARAAIITRGLAELTRLGQALGGQAETLMGLSGIGDLVLTCTSPLSRNMSLGFALGQGQSLPQALSSSKGVAEGVTTTRAALDLAATHHIDMPITTAVDRVLTGAQSIDSAINALLSRPIKAESA